MGLFCEVPETEEFDGEAYAEPPFDDSFVEEREIVEKPPRQDVSIRPIRDWGVVIDHMQPYKEDVIVRLLDVRERRDIYRAATVKPVNRPGDVKGMLMIEKRELDDDDLRAIAAVSPGCTVNFVQDAKVRRKLRLRMPARIEGVRRMVCTNRGCITRPEHLEAVSPVLVRSGGDKLRCRYCDHLMDTVHFK